MKKFLTLFTALFFALSMMAADVLSIDFTQGQGDWTINNVNLGGISAVWQQTSNYGMKATGYAGGNHETESWLVSPVFDLSNASSYATLTFSHARKYGYLDQLHVIATTDSSLDWVELSVSAWPDGSSWDFITATADLTNFVGSSNVQVAFVYTSTTSGGPTWEIKTVNVSADIQGPVYYLVGTMTNWNPATGYLFMENPNVSGEYILDVTLHSGDQFKVVETIDGTITTWYPDGSDNNYSVTEMGNYTVHFRPEGDLYDGYYGYYYLDKKTYPRYDVADAIAADLQANAEIEVRGVVTSMEIKGTNFANYGSVIIYIADVNGAEGEFKLFNCYSLNESIFTSTDPAYDAESTTFVQITSAFDASGNTVHVGDTVVAYGKYLLYNNEVHELNTGCYLTEIHTAGSAIQLDFENLEAYYNPDTWEIYVYNMDDNNLQYPYVAVNVDANSTLGIAGTYNANHVRLYDENGYIEATQKSSIMIRYVSLDVYHCQFSFSTEDADYVVNATVYIKYAYNQYTNEEIILDEDPTTYYLVGTMNDWTPTEGYQFEKNPATSREYMLDVTLAEGDEFKVVGVYEGNSTWYPDGGDTYNYVVDANYVGEKTVYFRPGGNEDWESFHEGGFFYIKEKFVPQDIYANFSSGLVLNDLTAENNVWQLYKENEVTIAIWNSQIAGTYTVADMYDNYAWVYNEESDQRIHFAQGSVTVTATDNLDTVTIVGTLMGSDGNYYHIYMEYTAPVAQKEETLNVEYAYFYDENWSSDGLYQVYGMANDTTEVVLGIRSDTRAGIYTTNDLYLYWSYIYFNNEYIHVYNADVTVTEHADGSFTIIADLLSNYNTLYHVTMTVPVYYLVGTMNNWTPTEGYRFDPDTYYSEYTLNATLAEGDEFKVVRVVNNEIISWYPAGENNNFVVTAHYAGEKTIYFRPYGTTEWESVHEGGYFYMEQTPVAENEETVIVPDAAWNDEEWSSEGLFMVYGSANDTMVVLGIYSDTKPGVYTMDNLNSGYSYLYIGEEYVSVYDADIIITENADGSYTVTADLLCYNNILYHVTMTVPVYYLVGTMNNWTPTEGYRLELNPNNEGEYMLNATLAVGDEFKIVKVANNQIMSWYPGGENNNYVVGANYAGENIVYFRPEGNTEWESFHEGGFFYIYIPQHIYITCTSDVTYLDNTSAWGWWEMSAQTEEYTILLSNNYSTQAEGTYTDSEIDLSYSKLNNNGSTIRFVSGTFTLSIDANSGNITLSGTLRGNDGNYYHIYMLYIAPVAQREETLIVPEAEFNDEDWDYGVTRVSGMANDTIYVLLSIITDVKPGTYAEENLYSNGSYIDLNNERVYIYDATVSVVENEDGSYTVTADLLCDNNTLYHVTMTVPAQEQTAIDNIFVESKAVKVVENGQLFIDKNGVRYNINGAVVR